MSDEWHLAQVNIGRARGEITDPIMLGFVARLEEINALAERSPGFVWRLQTEDGDVSSAPPHALVARRIASSARASTPIVVSGSPGAAGQPGF
jgi:hypothetical protein